MTVTWNWSDTGGSGIDSANCTTSSTSSGEGVIILRPTCKDLAGNIGTDTYGVKVDKTPPTISAAATTSPNGAGWYNSNVTVHFTCTDAVSGIPSGNCPPDQVLSTQGTGIASTAKTVTDTAGNVSQPSNVVTVNIDKTAPTANPTQAPTANANGWNSGDVTVTWNWSDTGSSGIDSANCTTSSTSTGEGVISLSPTCKDIAGNTGTDAYSVKVDKTAPTISAAATTSANGGGWYNGNVTVHFTCTDAASGIPSGNCPADQVLSTEGTGIASTAETVTDAAGNLSEPSNVVTVNIDKTAPTISAAATTSPNAAGWYNGDVTVHFTCSDALSGIPSGNCPADQVLSTEGSGVASTAKTVTDAAGNVSQPSNVISVNIDETAPTISAAATTSPNGAGWYNGNVTVHFTCSDALSGIPSGNCPADQVLSTEGTGIASTAETVTDAAGNVSQPSNVVSVNIDKTAPSASPAQAPAANANGWNSADVTVSWNWSDNAGGSGTDSANCTTSSASSGEGVISLSATCKDIAGNTGNDSYSVKVDTTPPTISAAATTSPNGAGWYNGDVTVHFTCSDALSGIPSGNCPADQVLSTEGTGIASTAETVTDAAGNVSQPSNVVSVNIDKTPPVVTISSPPNGVVSRGVSLTFSADDGTGSGLTALAGTLTYGSSGVTLPVPSGYKVGGPQGALYTLSVTAADAAGNTSSSSVTFVIWDVRTGWFLGGSRRR